MVHAGRQTLKESDMRLAQEIRELPAQRAFQAAAPPVALPGSSVAPPAAPPPAPAPATKKNAKAKGKGKAKAPPLPPSAPMAFPSPPAGPAYPTYPIAWMVGTPEGAGTQAGSSGDGGDTDIEELVIRKRAKRV